MAITDILTRIDTDAAAEAAEVLQAAEAEAARIASDAEATLARERAALLEKTEREADEAGATLLANARLAARDELLASKRALAMSVLERTREAVEALPDAEYIELIAPRVASGCAGGETLAVAPADAKRLSGLPARLRELGCEMTASAEPAPIERGVLLAGDRVRVEISPASIVADRRDELLLVAARTLFGEEE